METQLKENTKYTVINIPDWIPITQKEEIIIVRYSDLNQRYIYRCKGQKKEFLLPFDAYEWLFFEGHDLPLKLDSETYRYLANAAFNFVSDNPVQLKQYILNNCINPDPNLLKKILVTPEREEDDYWEDYPYTFLFEEEQKHII